MLQSLCTALLSALILSCCFIAPSIALDDDVKQLIRQVDPDASFRDDALIILSDGTEYVLVSPIEEKPHDTLTFVGRLPEDSDTADIVLFNDGHFLLRIAQLPSGQSTFPVIADLPIELRNGLLPQDFEFPENFYVPTAWKSLTGNLLLDGPKKKKTPSFPLAVINTQSNALSLWDPKTGALRTNIPLSCHGSDVAVSADASKLYVGCADRPQLYVYDTNGKSLQTLTLEHPTSDLLLNPETGLLYATHPTLLKKPVGDYRLRSQKILVFWELKKKKPDYAPINPNAEGCRVDQTFYYFDNNQITSAPLPDNDTTPSTFLFWSSTPDITTPNNLAIVKDACRSAISVIDTNDPNHSQSGILLKVPVKQLAFSPFRKRLYAISSPGKSFQVINTTNKRVEKMIPFPTGVSSLYIQNEKILWLMNDKQAFVTGFDLRWQEFSPPLQLSGPSIAMQSDNSWLYILTAGNNTIHRFDSVTLEAAQPISLQPGIQPTGLIFDVFAQRGYVPSARYSGIQVINLNQGEWAKTTRAPITALHGHGEWVIPVQKRPSQRTKIKFQDARQMLRNAKGLQWETLLSSPHDPLNIQSPSVHEQNQTGP